MDDAQPHEPKRQRTEDARPAGTAADLRLRTAVIPSGKPVFLRLPSGMVKLVPLTPNTDVSIGKFGTFRADDIIGRPFGPTYEILSDGSLEIMSQAVAEVLAETEATNENIYDDGESQTLSYEDIKALKASGASGRDIIQKQLESNKSYESRTVFSQDKIMKRKESKHLRFFTPLPPDMLTVAKYNFERSPEKIRSLRDDSLAQCLSFANVHAGGRYLVVDGVGGLLTGAILERMGGCGLLFAVHDTDSPPPFELMPQYNLTQTHTAVLRSIHWAATERRWKLPAHMAEELAKEYPNDRDRRRASKKRHAIEEYIRSRNEFFSGKFDAVLVACPYEPYSIIHRLTPLLAGSANVVVHSPYLQPLVETQARLRARHSYVNVSVSEPWLRRYQVLPGRTHPEMTTSASGGYILNAVRILDEDEADACVASMSEQTSPAVDALAKDPPLPKAEAGQAADDTKNDANGQAPTEAPHVENTI